MSSQRLRNRYSSFNSKFGQKREKEIENTMRIENIALMCHELNRAYCQMIGKDIPLPWDQTPEDHKQLVIDGVRFAMLNDPTPIESHEHWFECKEAQGWKYGPVKDESAKTHPCMVDYKDLPQDQKIKDIMFICMVKMMAGGD